MGLAALAGAVIFCADADIDAHRSDRLASGLVFGAQRSPLSLCAHALQPAGLI
jgi:hypothetical protein